MNPIRARWFQVAIAVAVGMVASLLIAAAAPRGAYAAESGVVYTQYRFHGDAGDTQTGSNRAFTTYGEDGRTYTARINATGGAIDIAGCWSATAGDGADITGECAYDGRSGLVHIPRAYIDGPVTVVVELDAAKSATTVSTTLAVVSGAEQGRSTASKVDVRADAQPITLPVAGRVKAVTQDSQLLDPGEWSADGGALEISGRSVMSGSITVYLDTFEAEVSPHNAVESEQDNAIARSLSPGFDLEGAGKARSALKQARGGAQVWIYSTNPGPGDWDYTDYVASWGGNSATLYCCQHGVYHMPASDGGYMWMSMNYSWTGYEGTYDTYTDTHVVHHNKYRDYYDLYIDAGYYQDVSGSWSSAYETLTYTPRTGNIAFTKKSSDPGISGSTSYYRYDAVYGVYSDPGCGSLVGNVQANASGRGVSGPLNVGWYYVKETRAPRGFELDPTAHPVYVSADATAYVNGGTVTDKPMTATVRFYVDGDTTPVHTDIDRPLGSRYDPTAPGIQRATLLAAKPNCTPGLNAWYTDKALTKKYTGTTLNGDLALYARNVATVTYAPTAGSALSEDLPLRKKMEETSPLIDVAKDVLPPSREANWGSKIALKDPLLKVMYYHDGERWRTLRWVEGGWFKASAGVGGQVSTLPIDQDTTIYGEFSRSTYDGIFSW